ncbi:hypothetical protein AAG570_012169 [Ranatra chinensis]|uniref:Uncharacterized protein n=1 Tax=Ranatra chinensis TaxID=642074 RepID=A0ABD0Z4C4_9HEMI
MPRVKSAKTLYDICQLFINKLLLRAVQNIHEEHGPYSNLKCQLYLQNLQEFLLSQLHWYVLDNLLHTVELPNGFEDSKKLMILSVYLHPQMRYMLPNFKLPPKDSFYSAQICKLNKIVVLDLTMVCTDEILKVVGHSCPALKEVRIVSKVESVTTKTRLELNALKLKFFVSDDGLQHIHQCKNLRRIIMNQILRSNCGGRKITHDGIRKLLIALPKLQYINYSDMGLVLESGIENVNQLNLRKLHDYHILPCHIDVYSSLCPDLQEICLKVPMTSVDQNMPNECIDRLTESKLQLASLELAFFPFEDQIKKYLRLKGNFLVHFSIFCGSNVTAENLYLLGKCCPNLKSLQVKILHQGPREDVIRKAKHNYFKNLENLHLIGINWDPKVIFPLCIVNAKNLRILGLINREYIGYADGSFKELLHKNPLKYLQNACLHDGFSLTQETLESFFMSCQNLQSLTVAGGLFQFLKDIQIRYNYDVQVQCDDSAISSLHCHCYNRSSSI